MEVERNRIVCEDCIEFMESLPDDSVDLVVADPPYNLSRKGSGFEWEDKNWGVVDEEWDSMNWESYREVLRTWICEIMRVLSPEGSIWVFASYFSSPFVNMSIRRFGSLVNEIVWYKPDAFPNMSTRMFTHSHETILWGTLSKDYIFNYDDIKKREFVEDRLKERGKQMRTVWHIPKSKEAWENEHGSHPTQKPVRVLDRIVLSTSNEGDLVFDPFVGSGTTAVSAKRLGRDYLGCDNNEEYVELARKRVEDVVDGRKKTDPLKW